MKHIPEDEENTDESYTNDAIAIDTRGRLCDSIKPPTQDEIYIRVKDGNHHLGFKHFCIYCDSTNTEFIRNGYWICHRCMRYFTVHQAMEHLETVRDTIREGLRKGSNQDLYSQRNSDHLMPTRNNTQARDVHKRSTTSFDDLRNRLKGGH